MCGCDGIQRGNYFGGEPISRTEVEVIVGELKNGKAVGKDESSLERWLRVELTWLWNGFGGCAI